MSFQKIQILMIYGQVVNTNLCVTLPGKNWINKSYYVVRSIKVQKHDSSGENSKKYQIHGLFESAVMVGHTSPTT